MIHHAIKNLTKEKPPGDGLSELIADLCESSRLALPSVASGPPYYYGPPSHLICSHERPLSHSMRRWCLVQRLRWCISRRSQAMVGAGVRVYQKNTPPGSKCVVPAAPCLRLRL